MRNLHVKQFEHFLGFLIDTNFTPKTTSKTTCISKTWGAIRKKNYNCSLNYTVKNRKTFRIGLKIRNI